MNDQPCKTPIEDMLRAIPRDLRISFETDDNGFKVWHSCPIGHEAHEAAEEIIRLRAELSRASATAQEGPTPCGMDIFNPLSLKEAKAQGVCRICRVDDKAYPGNPFVYHFGIEYAHRKCLDALSPSQEPAKCGTCNDNKTIGVVKGGIEVETGCPDCTPTSAEPAKCDCDDTNVPIGDCPDCTPASAEQARCVCSLKGKFLCPSEFRKPVNPTLDKCVLCGHPAACHKEDGKQ